MTPAAPFPALTTSALAGDVAYPAWIDGRGAHNRAVAPGQLGDISDIEAVQQWLVGSAVTTQASYAREARRLIKWSWEVARKPLSGLTYQDFVAYEAFLQAPPGDWVGKRRLSPAHPDWRPFAGPLAPSSIRQALVALSGLFAWLKAAGYCNGNPLALDKRRQTADRDARTERYLTTPQWRELMRTVSLEREGPQQVRDRWLLSVLWFGLRVSEVAQAAMNDLVARQDGERARWFLRVVGKGRKKRLVPVTSELLAESTRYRAAHGLPPQPLPQERLPLLLRLDLPLPLPAELPVAHLTRAAVHMAVKRIAHATADRLEIAGDTATATLIRQVSSHWIRHSAGSAMVNAEGLQPTMVRDVLGHESLATTNIYLHTAENERQDKLEQVHRLAWNNLD